MRTSSVRSFAVAAFSGLLLLSASAQLHAATAAEIDAKVADALAQFRKEVSGAQGHLDAAKAVLVIPDVKKVGFVIAGQWGTGALQVGGKTVDYYKMTAGSAGFQAGYQEADFVFIFFTQEAVDKFREGEGWTVGGEAGLTLVEVGTAVSADTLKGEAAVAGFSFGREGLMAGWSAKGTKFERVKPD